MCVVGAGVMVAVAAGLEGAGGLEVLELEEDAAGGWGSACVGKGCWVGNCRYHPAALERAADSINGVDTQGLGRSGGGRLPMVEDSGVVL